MFPTLASLSYFWKTVSCSSFEGVSIDVSGEENNEILSASSTSLYCSKDNEVKLLMETSIYFIMNLTKSTTIFQASVYSSKRMELHAPSKL